VSDERLRGGGFGGEEMGLLRCLSLQFQQYMSFAGKEIESLGPDNEDADRSHVALLRSCIERTHVSLMCFDKYLTIM
jgi:hypothetical protein